MTDPERAVLAWSGGKDAAAALAVARQDPSVSVERLFTTVSAATDRVTMHRVRPVLIRRQATAMGLPVDVAELPAEPSDATHAARMRAWTTDYADRGFDRLVFADLCLEDVRAYRESHLADVDLDGLWPVWGRDTAAFARAIIDRGVRATVVCVDGDALDRSFVGRPFDRAFLTALPDDVDPCGEHGEFHTFVRDAPSFETPVAIDREEIVTRTVRGRPFHYCEVGPS